MKQQANLNLVEIRAAERQLVNREWLDAFAAAGLRRASSQELDSVITDIRRLMLREFARREKELRIILEEHGITEAPRNRERPIWQYDPSSESQRSHTL